MQEVSLAAEARDQRGSAASRRLRREGRVPAVVYGLDTDAQSVTISAHEIQKLLQKAGANVLINLQLAGEGQLTMAREVQRHPVRGDLVHIDFVRIREDVAVEADVPVHLVGEPVGLKEGGILEHVLFEVTVSAKPRELPTGVEVDVSELNIGEQKRVADLPMPPGVEVVTDLERVVANVVVPRVEEEATVALSAEEAEELEGLSEEELAALAELAAEAEEGEEGEAAEGEDGEAGGDDAAAASEDGADGGED